LEFGLLINIRVIEKHRRSRRLLLALLNFKCGQAVCKWLNCEWLYISCRGAVQSWFQNQV